MRKNIIRAVEKIWCQKDVRKPFWTVVLVCLNCSNKIPQTERLKHHTGLECGKSKVKMLADLVSAGVPFLVY